MSRPMPAPAAPRRAAAGYATPQRVTSPRRRARGRAAAAGAVALAISATAGCAAAVSVPVAPNATDPVCAAVVLALPAELGDSPRLRTTSQATAAWGEPTAPIVLRCGVDLLPPTTDQCVTATDATGTSVDWVAVEEPADVAGASGPARWTFTTYGREPAIEVTVPGEVTSVRSTSFLVDLGPAINRTSVLRNCL